MRTIKAVGIIDLDGTILDTHGTGKQYPGVDDFFEDVRPFSAFILVTSLVSEKRHEKENEQLNQLKKFHSCSCRRFFMDPFRYDETMGGIWIVPDMTWKDSLFYEIGDKWIPYLGDPRYIYVIENRDEVIAMAKARKFTTIRQRWPGEKYSPIYSTKESDRADHDIDDIRKASRIVTNLVNGHVSIPI